MSLLPISFPQLPRSPPTTSHSNHNSSSKEIEIRLRNRFESQHRRYVPSIGSSVPQQRKADPEIINQLRTDVEGLLTELSGLSRRNNELMAAKDSGLAIICDLDTQLKEYK
ncbi:hypothetical protein PILCRDRAFT_8926 [Piloderma croceum F 1598]|uniref:Uncharacterized protein n=1 Tax=Piloderma croceum (strain F 1598) TaxID=765440 RepID=A0A0C3FNE8_PILCF|nr:hypothetical protein PILCRDRAFT_8926 [Piloderma croceum F 1598]